MEVARGLCQSEVPGKRKKRKKVNKCAGNFEGEKVSEYSVCNVSGVRERKKMKEMKMGQGGAKSDFVTVDCEKKAQSKWAVTPFSLSSLSLVFYFYIKNN